MGKKKRPAVTQLVTDPEIRLKNGTNILQSKWEKVKVFLDEQCGTEEGRHMLFAIRQMFRGVLTRKELDNNTQAILGELEKLIDEQYDFVHTLRDVILCAIKGEKPEEINCINPIVGQPD